MSLTIGDQLSKFMAFASEKSENTIVRTDINGNISAATKDKIAPLWRSRANKDANNVARDLFKEAVGDMFGGTEKIPKDVRDAMKLDDKHFGNSGKPLTARRIMAVKRVLDTIDSRIADGLAKVMANPILKEYDLRNDGMTKEDRDARIDSLLSTAVHVAAGDKDVLDIVVPHIKHFIENGVGEFRSEDKVKQMVTDLMANMSELRTAAKGNREIMKAGKQFLNAMGGKSLPNDMIKNLVTCVSKMKIGAIKGLSVSSSTVSIHKAIQQYLVNIDTAMEASGAKALLEGPEEKGYAMGFIGDIMLARCSAATAKNIYHALACKGDTTFGNDGSLTLKVQRTASDELLKIYNCLSNNKVDGISDGLMGNIRYLSGALSTALPQLKENARLRCGIRDNVITNQDNSINNDDDSIVDEDNLIKTGDDQVKGKDAPIKNQSNLILDDDDPFDNNPPVGWQEIHELLVPFAKQYAADQRKAFINKVVQGDGASAEKARKFHERNISIDAYQPQVNTTRQRNAITIGMINRNICDNCKIAAIDGINETDFYKDLVRGDMNVTLKIGGETVKMFDDFQKEVDDLTKTVTNGRVTRYSMDQLNSKEQAAVKDLLKKRACDKLASFVTGGKTTKYDELDGTSKTKTHILMSLLNQQSITVANVAHSCALDPKGRDDEMITFGAEASKKEYALSFDGNGRLVFECHSNMEGLQTVSFLDTEEEEIELGPGSSLQSSFSIYIKGEEFDRLAKLDFSKFDNTQIREAEDDPNVKHHRQKPELLGEGFGFAKNSVGCSSDYKMILN